MTRRGVAPAARRGARRARGRLGRRHQRHHRPAQGGGPHPRRGGGVGPGHLGPPGRRPGHRPVGGLPPPRPHRRPGRGDPGPGHRHPLHRPARIRRRRRWSGWPARAPRWSPWSPPPSGGPTPRGTGRCCWAGRPPRRTWPGNVVTTYGMTETGSGVVYDGRPLDGVELRIGDGAGGPRGRSSSGARCCCAPTATAPTRGWPAAGSRPATPAGSGPDGTLIVFGRMAEVIVTGGEKVWPAPVEQVLAGHPGVARWRCGSGPTRSGATGWWPGWYPVGPGPAPGAGRAAGPGGAAAGPVGGPPRAGGGRGAAPDAERQGATHRPPAERPGCPGVRTGRRWRCTGRRRRSPACGR